MTGGDVVDAGDVVLIRAGEPSARTIPVLAAFEDDLRALLVVTPPCEALVGGSSTAKNRASALVERIETGHHSPALSCPRLRATWLTSHLQAGTRLPELARAAGLASVTVLSDLLAYVEPIAEADSWSALRGRV